MDRNFNPFKMDNPSTLGGTFSSHRNTPSPQWESLYAGIPSRVNDPFEKEQVAPTLIEHPTEVKVQTLLYFQKKYIITYLKDKVLFYPCITCPPAHSIRTVSQEYYPRGEREPIAAISSGVRIFSYRNHLPTGVDSFT